MRSMGQYILSIGLASLVVAIIGEFSDQKSATGMLIRMICGLFLAFTVINPIMELNFGILDAFSTELPTDTVSAVSAGTELADDSLRQIIKQETRAYILDKARSMGYDPTVEVEVGKGEVPIPESVRITGKVPAHIRADIEEFLERELGISKENQQWIG